MSLVGLDLNASRARAVAGPSTQKLALLRLDSDRVELPCAISLEEKQPRVGRAGFALTRARPHLACLDFLPHLGNGRTWAAGPHSLDADAALDLLFAALQKAIGRPTGVACALPAYLDETQIVRLYRLAAETRMPLVGSITAPVAAVLASPVIHLPACVMDLVLVIDCDGYALTWSVVERSQGQLRLRMTQPATHLGRSIWIRKLLDGVAQRCVRHSRRDPRESAATEQAVYEQVVALLDQGVSRVAQLNIQGPGWFSNLMLQAEDLAAMVTPLLRQFLVDLDSTLATVESLGTLACVVVTHSAAGLPGVVSTVQARLQSRPRPAILIDADEEEDYGEQLVNTAIPEMVHVIGADALSATAYELAARIGRNEFPRGHHEAVALGAAGTNASPDTGPVRLSFRGQDHVLRSTSFTLGRDPTCDMVFESELYPHVSGRHCEIVFDRRAYVLYDRSRHGTLVNDRPVRQQASLSSGDWIRLGPRGPVLRFLGTITGSPTR